MKKAIIGLVVGLFLGTAGMAAAATSPSVQATLTKFSISINGEKQALKSDPLVYKGTTYLPVREVAGLFGADVANFDNATKSIEIVTKGETAVTLTNTSETTLSGRALVQLLADKYPEFSNPFDQEITLDQKGNLKLGEQTFQLVLQPNQQYDVKPLIDAGVLKASDLNQ